MGNRAHPRIEYRTDPLNPQYCELRYLGAFVILGEAAGGGDQKDWEILDGNTGKELYRASLDDYTTVEAAWPELMTEAHRQLFKLYDKMVAIAKRRTAWVQLLKDIEPLGDSLTHYLAGLSSCMEPTQAEVNHLERIYDMVVGIRDQFDELEDEIDTRENGEP